MSPWPSLWETPLPRVLVRCKRCDRTVAKYFSNVHGEGHWQPGDCTCDPRRCCRRGTSWTDW